MTIEDTDAIYAGLLKLTTDEKIVWDVAGTRTSPRFTTEIWDDDVNQIVHVTVAHIGERPTTTRVLVQVGNIPDQLAVAFNVAEARLSQAILDRVQEDDHQLEIARATIARVLAR